MNAHWWSIMFVVALLLLAVAIISRL